MLGDGCLPHLLWPLCVRCGKASLRPLCTACREEPLLDGTLSDGCRIWALSRYRLEGKLSPCAELIHRLKYAEQTCSAASLGWALSRHWPKALRGTTLVPVPLHPARLIERGFNQSALLARALVRYSSHIERAQRSLARKRVENEGGDRRSGLRRGSGLLARVGARKDSSTIALDPVELSADFAILKRRTPGRAQAQLDRDARRKNLRDAFVARPCSQRERERAIVVLDDVVTTGSTSSACARALSRAGYQVAGIVCCAISA